MQQEHYSVYRAILIAQGVEDWVFYFFLILANFFKHVKKLSNFWNFVSIKVAKSKLNHLG